MERIPRRALAGVAVLAFGLTLGLGPSGRTADGAPAARNRAISTAVADSVLKPVASTQALRPGAPVELVLTAPSTATGPVKVLVRSPVIGYVNRAAVAVDGTRLASFVPSGGRFSGASGALDRDPLTGGSHRVALTITRSKGSTITVSRTFSLPAPAPVTPVVAPPAPPVVVPTPAPIPTPAPAPQKRILWGAWVDGDAYGSGHVDPPWDMSAMSVFEQHAGRGASIVHYGQFWRQGGVLQPFYPGDHQRVRDHGAIPMLDWNPWDSSAGGSTSQPQFALARIAAGDFDAYIRSWATGARDWGHPMFLRFAHEMNGNWFPWSEGVNGNSAGQYVAAWRHVHDIFSSVGATNVTWVWSPNAVYPGSAPLAGLYPGDAYVDWVAIDGYNWGTNPSRPDVWKSFAQVFGATYDQLVTLAPSKPVMVAEVGSTEHGGSKAAWITDAMTRMPADFPRIGAVVWFNWNSDGDWSIESSAAAQAAFAQAVASPVFTGADFAGAPAGTIGVPAA